jgi:GTP:adenosylcobinamide-phosphate guanylyltransferase
MNIKDVSYIVIQAGGKGSRLEHYTFNKPKCLLSVGGEPMLYRLFREFPNAHFIIIGDYLYDVLERYLRVVSSPVSYELVRSYHRGTLAGMNKALSRINDPDAPFHIIWSDLLFETFPQGEVNDEPIIGLSRSFLCRWSLDRRGKIVNLPSDKRGIAGFFCFPNKRFLDALPKSGEFVEYLSNSVYRFTEMFLYDVYELGSLEAVYNYRENRPVTRFFNIVEIKDTVVIKRARDKAFDHLIAKEVDWYEKVSQMKFKNIPRVISRAPFIMERIDGNHPFDLNISEVEKRRVLDNILNCFDDLHRIDAMPSDYEAIRDIYYQKSIDRVSVVQEIIPNIKEEIIGVNNLPCRNPLHPKYSDWFREKVETLLVDRFFLIHGDTTFSNILIDRRAQPWLIDPRGYFSNISFYGDRRYDWAKLYYSVRGNYDQFNRKRFRLEVEGATVKIDIESNGWELQADVMRERFEGDFAEIELIHALIWISLSGYVKDDLDSVLASFYNGLYWLEQTEL